MFDAERQGGVVGGKAKNLGCFVLKDFWKARLFGVWPVDVGLNLYLL